MSVIASVLFLIATLASQEPQTYEQRFIQAAKKQRAEDLANLPELKRIGDEQRRRAAAESAENLAREQAAWRYGTQARQPDSSYSATDSGYATSSYGTTSYVAPGAYLAIPVRMPHVFLPNANVSAFGVSPMFRGNGMFIPRSFGRFSMRR
ncbi:MAG TPA: hypothetical protein VKE40_08430 [Gemmataceae bacterium]|nr:hypothetical protein [Gemmataceae bacterium]